jgi:pyridoxamine 5'-phosphate oxidase
VSTAAPHDPPAGPLEGLESGLADPLSDDPTPIFRRWFREAVQTRATPNPNAMTLATVDADGHPCARIVLCKGASDDGTIDFYTNRRSRKGVELAARARACAVFHWDHAGRQVRLDGPVIELSDAESDAYFQSRPWPRRLGAWASAQSEPIASRADLESKVRQCMVRFGLDPDRPPPMDGVVESPRPPHWGGYRLVAESVELWASHGARLHDRAVWRRDLGPPAGPWQAMRLQP